MRVRLWIFNAFSLHENNIFFSSLGRVARATLSPAERAASIDHFYAVQTSKIAVVSQQQNKKKARGHLTDITQIPKSLTSFFSISSLSLSAMRSFLNEK